MTTTPFLPAALLLAILAVPCTAHAYVGSFTNQAEQDKVLKEVGVDEKLGAPVPKNIPLKDQDGHRVRLGDFLGGVPVILTLNYYECPMLCPITFSNLIDTMRQMKGLAPDKDFRVVTASFNPDEDLARTSARAKETYAMLTEFRDPGRWWTFLFGGSRSIDTLTTATGFRYVKLGPDNFAHPSVMIVLTPDGRISRYLYGMKIDPKDLRLALLEAAGGKIGASSALNQILLFCYHYDPVGRKYQLAATRVMAIGGAVTGAALAVLLLLLWRREKKKRTGREDA